MDFDSNSEQFGQSPDFIDEQLNLKRQSVLLKQK